MIQRPSTIPPNAAARVTTLAALVRSERAEVSRGRAGRVGAVAELARGWLLESASRVRADLTMRVAEVERLGSIPSLFTLMGDSWRERPYNTVLAWVFDPAAGHGAGRLALAALADALSLPALAADARSADAGIVVRGELPWPPEAASNRMPDLLVLTPSTTLLVENKVLAGESGEGQYKDYLDAVERLAAARGTSAAAWLCAPSRRDVPAFGDGRVWSGFITHREVAVALSRAAADPAMTAWGRVVCLLVAEQLDAPNGRAGLLTEARACLARVGVHPSPRDIATMRHLIARLVVPPPPSQGSRP